MRRALFSSIHSYLDPSSGAALASRDLWELLAARGVDCRVVTAGVLDYDEETSLESILQALAVPYALALAPLTGGGVVEVYDMTLDGVRITLVPTSSSRGERSPTPGEARTFLDLAGQVLDRFRPEVLLTYGGHPANLELTRLARRSGIPVAFHLHNFAYTDRTAFEGATVILFPSEYSRRHYARTIGLDGPVIPDPLRAQRVIATERTPRFLTFVNPQPSKGAAVFARIALELGQRRPDIPLLVVEGRGSIDWLARVPLDLSSVTTFHRMANTVDPRDFYRVSRAVLMPSVWRESLGRVAMEALANGLPVLASDRGALPETLGRAGLVLPLPDHCTPDITAVPTAREVAPWIAAIERLWDDRAFEAEHRRRALEEARRWDDDRIAAQYLAFFEDVIRKGHG